ncbi:MAG: class F sortase [Candidatus Pacebacteria bacterium]|nr:class F sortase [Candidatus Paceibacterota bacterium]
MQRSEKSFLVSLLVSFVFAFSVAAYLSSPFTVRIETVTAAADTTHGSIETVVEASTPGIPFLNINIISIIEIPSELTFATTSPVIAREESEREAVQVAKVPVKKPLPRVTAYPVRLIIPSIGLSAPVTSVGLNEKGEMDVPEGNTPDVGWYKHGTIPGNIGSAVIDAHVFAAFENLRDLKVGSEVYVENSAGERLTFVVDDSRVYQLGELTSGMLFGKKDTRRLNLITCAGEQTPDGSTYTHRLVVYTKLVA